MILRLVLGTVLGCSLYLGAAIVETPPPPRCPHCVLLTHPYGCAHALAIAGGGYSCQ